MSKKISFCIPTGINEREYLNLLLTSLEDNLSRQDHEVIVFVDTDNQGTYNWLTTERDNKFEDLKILRNPLGGQIGYQLNVNMMMKIAKYDIVSVIQSDMVVGKNYDLEVLRHLKNENTIVSATRIEPPLHPPSPEKVVLNLGLNPLEFKLDEFTSAVEKHTDYNKTTHFWFAPFTLYKERWNEVGGHDTLFRRAREDTDVLMRLKLNGCEFVQTWSAFVYHFTCVSSRGKDWYKVDGTKRADLQSKADQIEMNKFFRKWKQFEHSAEPSTEEKYLYDCSLVIKNSNKLNIDFIIKLSQYFDRIYLDDNIVKESILKIMKDWDSVANQLYSYSDEFWNHKHNEYYRKYSYDDIILPVYADIVGDVIVDVNGEDINSQDRFQFLSNINSIVHHSVDSEGEFEYDVFKISVDEKRNRIKDNIIVKNPELDFEVLGV
jgi:GT2 family glycosyltransferase